MNAPSNIVVPSFREALRFWFKLGCISFGGPAGQIAIMQSELVDRLRWVEQGVFLRGLGFCTLLPGPEAQQLATYVGWRLHGLRGALVAGGLFVLPGALLLLLLSWVAAVGRDIGWIAAIFDGLKPVVVAIVAHAVWRIGKRSLKGWPPILLAAASFIAIFVLRIDFPWIVMAAGLIGFMAARAGHSPFVSGAHAGGAAAGQSAPAARLLPRLLGIGAIYLILLVSGVGIILLLFGTKIYSDIAILFTKAAFVTFGGAYAVLPYVAEEAVRSYGWLSAGEMLNGLALAETTPGPLILVLQYVGFFAVWNAWPAEGRLAAAIAGATLTTYVTFLPSFALVLIGAPYIERMHDDKRIGSALGAITAAVVGVILNLTVFLAMAIFMPAGKPIEFVAIVIALAALFALIRYNVAIHWLVIAGAIIGLVRAGFTGTLF
jgi:chromate transporter